jgi:hypothetical protein
MFKVRNVTMIRWFAAVEATALARHCEASEPPPKQSKCIVTQIGLKDRTNQLHYWDSSYILVVRHFISLLDYPENSNYKSNHPATRCFIPMRPDKRKGSSGCESGFQHDRIFSSFMVMLASVMDDCFGYNRRSQLRVEVSCV